MQNSLQNMFDTSNLGTFVAMSTTTRKKISEKHKGRKLSEATKQKMRKNSARKGKKLSAYQSQRIIETNKKRKLSPESLAKMRESNKRTWALKVQNGYVSPNIGRKLSNETKQKLSVAGMGNTNAKRKRS